MHAHDRYALALAILEGDRDARKVLADCWTRRGSAAWRKGRNRLENRLDFAIMNLPCDDALLLGAHFLDDFLGSRILELGEKLRAVPIVQSWTSSATPYDATHAALHEVHRRLERATVQHFASHDPVQELIRAIECSHNAQRCTGERAGHNVTHLQHEAKQAIRAVSYYTRRRTSILVQVQRTKVLLEDLLSA
jgi:hypothetical protein